MFYKKIEANSKFFQLPTCTYGFLLAGFVQLNILPFVTLFLVDIVKYTFLVATFPAKLVLREVASCKLVLFMR